MLSASKGRPVPLKGHRGSNLKPHLQIYTRYTCSRIQILSSVLLADTIGYNLYPGYMYQLYKRGIRLESFQDLDENVDGIFELVGACFSNLP